MTDTDHNPHAIIHTRSALTGLTDKGVWFEELTRRRDLSTAIYQPPPGAHDPQTPHGEQEIYCVLSGHGQITISGTEHHVATGDLIDVPAGADHRFHSIIDTLQLLAVFAPAFGTIQS